jgi:peptidoglycan hydrolase-like protein with peptidoglycan-binding domain
MKYTADALDSTDFLWLSRNPDAVNPRLLVQQQLPFRGQNRNPDAIRNDLLVVGQLTHPGPNRNPDAVRSGLLTTPYRMTGLRREGGYEDAGSFTRAGARADDAGKWGGGGHHPSGGFRRGRGFGLRGRGIGYWGPDYVEEVVVPICYDQQGNQIPCPLAPADAYEARGLAKPRAMSNVGPPLESASRPMFHNAGSLQDPQDFARFQRDWQGNAYKQNIVKSVPFGVDEEVFADGRLRDASGIEDDDKKLYYYSLIHKGTFPPGTSAATIGAYKQRLAAKLNPVKSGSLTEKEVSDWIAKISSAADLRATYPAQILANANPDQRARMLAAQDAHKQAGLAAMGKVGGILGGVISATNVVKGAVSSVTTPVAHFVTAPALAAVAIARGDNIVSTLGNTFKSQIADLKTLAPVAQTIVSFVPGVGQGVNAAIAAGTALAQGKNITDALVSGVKNALPGGPLAAKAFDAGFTMAKAAATGGNIGQAALEAARANLPGGPVAQQAFDVALAVAHGQNVQKVLISGAVNLAQSQATQLAGQAVDIAKGAIPMPSLPSNISDFYSPVRKEIFSNVGPVIGKIQSITGFDLLPTPIKMVANAILANPAMRSLPIATLAKNLNVTIDQARQGVASVVQAVQKIPSMGGRLPALSQATRIADQLSHDMSVDSAMSHFASRAAPVSFNPNATRRIPRGRMREVRWHTNRAGKLAQVILKGSSTSQAMGFDASGPGDTVHGVIGQGSTGPDVVAWQNVLLASKGRIGGITITTADGQFGPMTVSSTRAWQAANGLTADGAVGPLTWSKALGTTVPAAQPIVLPTSTGPVVNPVVAVTQAISSAMQTGASHALISQGSSGPDVIVWQKIIGVSPADGSFGPLTDAATRIWQTQHGLTADGKVGPATWAAALGVSTPNPAASTVPVLLGGSTVQTYLVTAGDSMTKIAQKFTGDGNRWRELAAANPQIKDPNKLFVGQVLTLPASWGAPVAQAPATANPTLGAPPGTLSGITRTISEGTQFGIPGLTPMLPSITSTPTPEGPVVATTLPGGVTTVEQPPITATKPGTGLLVFGLAIAGAIASSGKKIFA